MSEEITHIVKWQCVWKYTKEQYEDNLIKAEGKPHIPMKKMELRSTIDGPLITTYICGEEFDPKKLHAFDYEHWTDDDLSEFFRHHMYSHHRDWKLGKVYHDAPRDPKED